MNTTANNATSIVQGLEETRDVLYCVDSLAEVLGNVNPEKIGAEDSFALRNTTAVIRKLLEPTWEQITRAINRLEANDRGES